AGRRGAGAGRGTAPARGRPRPRDPARPPPPPRTPGLGHLTGGWPLLLDRALELRKSGHDQDTVLGELAEATAREGGARELAEATGILEDEAVYEGYRMIVGQLGTGWNRKADAEAAVELAVAGAEDARWVLMCLETRGGVVRGGGGLGGGTGGHRAGRGGGAGPH
ncbi:hypothetical protein, partial [Streptomyces sp. NPDC058953]|uniref:hypothetical protein n=1 Tax=Streptomyces sp. NPDC058953 TaxID=3346676 RepID=UPI0036794F6D